MCMICASIPATMALGVSAHARQKRKRSEAAARGEAPKSPAIPAGKASVTALVALVLVASLIHSQQLG
jgi:hypothetical protein